MNLQQDLLGAGLKMNEVEVYLYLLAHGLATPPQIARGTHIARPNCYKILTSLKEKGLLSEQKKGKRKIFLASDPSALVHSLHRQAETMNQLLPDLRALHVAQKNKPSIRFFEGAEQVKAIFHEMLEAKEVFGMASTKKLYAALGSDFFKTYIQEMKKRQILLKDILTKDSVSTSATTPIEILKGMYEFRELPEKMGDVPVDILIWNNKVAFISVEAPIFGTLIEHAPIAQMMKILFGLSWKQL